MQLVSFGVHVEDFVRLQILISNTGLALGQMTTKLVAFQWIFAWVIAGVLLVASVVFAAPSTLGNTIEENVEAAPTVGGNRERQPLLGNN